MYQGGSFPSLDGIVSLNGNIAEWWTIQWKNNEKENVPNITSLNQKPTIEVLNYSFLPRSGFLVPLHALPSPEENSTPRLMVSIVYRLTSTNMITQKYTINRFNIFSTDPILFMLILEFNAIWNRKKRLWEMRENEPYNIFFLSLSLYLVLTYNTTFVSRPP